MCPPSSDEMRTWRVDWRHSARVLSELNALQCLIDRVKSLGLANDRAGHIKGTSTASTVARCQPIGARGGSQIVDRGVQLSVLELVRTCRRMSLAQNRNLRGRYETMHGLRITPGKVPSAPNAGEDVAVGSNIVTVFQGDP
jgi:hypothetical protein